MKKLLTLTIAFVGLLFAACETENGITKGEIIINSETNIEIGLYAGEFVIDYDIKGITDVDATITTTSDWLRVKENKGGKAKIEYEENTSGGSRQAAVMLSYEGAKATVVVSQSSEAVTPILTLVGEDTINLDRAGRDLGSLEWGGAQMSFISGLGGCVLWIFFIFYLWQTFKTAKAGDSDESYTPMSIKKALLLIIGGLVGLVVGGEVIVKSATSIAQSLGVSDAIIGLTVVALGTSLPELATSCMAAMKKNCDIALGNVVGSNIFNIFFILGTSACVMPLPGYQGLEIDAIMAALGSLFVLGFVYLNKQRKIQRWHGALLLLCYAAYLTYRILTL